MATASTTSASRARKRPPLTRDRILREALALVDEEGLAALTMRRLGKRLGVEAMSLYNHIEGKDGLRAGIVGLLWEEVERSLTEGDDWRDALRSLARHLRGLGTAHPHAFPLLSGATSFTVAMLRAQARGLAILSEAGFDERHAGQTLYAVQGYATGFAAMEAVCLAAGLTDSSEADQVEDIVELTRALPPDLPPELVRVVRDSFTWDFDEQFEFGLEALLAGVERDPASESRRGAAAR